MLFTYLALGTIALLFLSDTLTNPADTSPCCAILGWHIKSQRRDTREGDKSDAPATEGSQVTEHVSLMQWQPPATTRQWHPSKWDREVTGKITYKPDEDLILTEDLCLVSAPYSNLCQKYNCCDIPFRYQRLGSAASSWWRAAATGEASVGDTTGARGLLSPKRKYRRLLISHSCSTLQLPVFSFFK